MCTHTQCFEPKQEKYQNFSADNFQFLKLIKNLCLLNRQVFVMQKRHANSCNKYIPSWCCVLCRYTDRYRSRTFKYGLTSGIDVCNSSIESIIWDRMEVSFLKKI